MLEPWSRLGSFCWLQLGLSLQLVVIFGVLGPWVITTHLLMPLLICRNFFLASYFLLWSHYYRLDLFSWSVWQGIVFLKYSRNMVLRDHRLLIKSWSIFWKTLKNLVVNLNFLSIWGILDYNFWLTLSQIRIHLLRWPLISMCSTLWSIWFNTPNRWWKRLKSFAFILLFWLLVDAEICNTHF